MGKIIFHDLFKRNGNILLGFDKGLHLWNGFESAQGGSVNLGATPSYFII